MASIPRVAELATTPDMLAFVNRIAHWQPSVEPEQAATSTVDRAIYEARALLARMASSAPTQDRG
jgi:hypothetical protein